MTCEARKRFKNEAEQKKKKKKRLRYVCFAFIPKREERERESFINLDFQLEPWNRAAPRLRAHFKFDNMRATIVGKYDGSTTTSE